MNTFSQELFMLSTQHSHYRERVGAHNAAQASKILADIYSESRNVLVSNIEHLRESYIPNATPRQNSKFIKQLKGVILNIAAVREAPFEETLALIQADLSRFSEYESTFTLDKIFNKSADDTLEGLPISLAFEGIAPVALYAATMTTQVALGGALNGTLDSLIKGIPESEQRRMIETIQRGFVQGLTNQEIIKTVFNRQSGAAAETKTRNSIEAIVRTATNSMGNQAHKLISEANEDLVRGYRNSAVFDGRLSNICKSIALKFGDKVLPYNSFPPVPRHLRCRSLLLMALRSWSDVLTSGKVMIEDSQGTQAFFASDRKESSAQLTARLKSQGLTTDQISEFKSRMSGQTSKTTLEGFLTEQKERGNIGFLNTFFDSEERAQYFIDGKYKASELYNLESRKPISLENLQE